MRAYAETVTPSIRRATPADAPDLARVAALTFPLACPPSTTDEAKAQFIATKLSEAAFAGYLGAADHVVLIAEAAGTPVGYTMLITGEPQDPDVAAAVSARPTVELSKVYVLPEQHGTGVARALIEASLDAAAATGAASVWLGVNNENARANRFYEKSGFERVGTKAFRLGELNEHDYVRERVL